MDSDTIINLLEAVKLIIENQNEEERIKCEKFNIFSILNMETKENGTHSAFLGELLNPHGSHLQGRVFLKLFLNQIKHHLLDAESTHVTLEKYIGPVVINDKKPLESEGGRIDIYLEDAKGNSISIENKINAPEQKLQVVRYFNYRKGSNKVYYLTLKGQEPSSKSTGKLKFDEDYFGITYEHHILEWLEKCQKESTEHPILRENIKQYAHLIKKLTGTMENRHKKQLYNSILSNYEAALTISDNVQNARKLVCQEIREKVKEVLESEIRADYKLKAEMGSDITEKSSQIFLRPRAQPNLKPNKFELKELELNISISSFSGDGNYSGNMYMGIVNPPPHKSEYAIPPNKLSLGGWIINERKFSKFEDYSINLSNKRMIQKLYVDNDFKTRFINHMVQEILSYLKDEYPKLKSFIDTGKIPSDNLVEE